MTLDEFVVHLFDHPVAPAPFSSDNEWRQRRHALKNSMRSMDPILVSQLVAEMFEDAGRLLAPFSDDQVTQGLYYFWEISGLGFKAMRDASVSEAAQLRARHSIVPLFEQVMAIRCLPQNCSGQILSNPLNSVCYMWWDNVSGKPDEPKWLVYDAATLQVLTAILAIPQDACRESALHGLGHIQRQYPVQVASIIDAFLAATPDIPRSLADYANNARHGWVL